MGHTPLRIVSALLSTVLLTVPVLGAVCSMLCEPNAQMLAHRAHPAGVPHQAVDSESRGHHHGHPDGVASTAAHHHHASSPATVSDAPRPSAEWNGRCCEQPTLTLAAIPIVRHDLQIDPAVYDTVSLTLNGSDARPADPWRDTSRAPSAPSQSNPVLRI